MNVKKHTFMLLSIVLLSAPVLSVADMRGGHMMMGDEEREKMMKERYGERYREHMSDDDMPMGMGRGGMGMMGYGGMAMMDLDDKQRGQIRDIQRELRKKIWALKGQIMDEQDSLADLYDTDTRNASAIGKVYGKIFDLKRQVIEATVEAGNKRRAVLNKEQRERLNDMRGMMGGYGMGRGMGRGMGMMGSGMMGSGMMGSGMMGPGMMGPGMMGPGMMGGMGPGMGMMGGCNGMNW
ncbi:MAG: Spy/CpxP family protein refolding chaperone [Granulosicoccaceae bacterium]|jgi:Spy/CpxP family protein refolding chaperone